MSVAAAPRPRPEISEMTRGFWAAARRHELVRPVCTRCGRSFFVPQAVCTHCLADDWSYAQSSGRGTVYSATVVHRAPFPGIEVPFHLAVVDLEEDWSMLTNLLGAGDSAVASGTPVEVAWLDIDEDFTLPVFTVAREGER